MARIYTVNVFPSLAEADEADRTRDASIDSQSKRTEKVVSMLEASSLSEEELSVHLKDESIIFTNLDHVVGEVTYASASDSQQRYLHIQLMGISHVSMQTWEEGKYKTSTVEWCFLRNQMDMPLDVTTGKSAFAFELPGSLQPGQCPLNHSEHIALPPSTGRMSRPDWMNDLSPFHDAALNVYQIRAELKSRSTGELLGHSTKKFTFMPECNPSPSSAPAYSFEPKQDLPLSRPVRTLLGKKVGEMKLSVDPAAALLSSGTTEPVTSPLRLSLTYQGSSPPVLTKAKLTLLAHTSSRISHSQDGFDSSTRAHYIEREIQTTRFGADGILPWKQSNTEMHSWSATVCLPVTLIDNSSVVLPPSFETCLISRSYELRLALSLASADSVLSTRAALEFQFPIKVERPRRSSRRPATEPTEGLLEEDRPSYWDVFFSPIHPAPIRRVPEYDDVMPGREMERRPSWAVKAGEAVVPGQIAISLPG